MSSLEEAVSGRPGWSYDRQAQRAVNTRSRIITTGRGGNATTMAFGLLVAELVRAERPYVLESSFCIETFADPAAAIARAERLDARAAAGEFNDRFPER
jgi:hypothetical protein